MMTSILLFALCLTEPGSLHADVVPEAAVGMQSSMDALSATQPTLGFDFASLALGQDNAAHDFWSPRKLFGATPFAFSYTHSRDDASKRDLHQSRWDLAVQKDEAKPTQNKGSRLRVAKASTADKPSVSLDFAADKALKKKAAKAAPKKLKKPAKASSLLARVQSFFAQAKDLQAEFKQTYYKASLSVLAHSKGTLKVKKPKLMLWDYAGTAQDIYSNGQEVWFVEHDTRQVVSSSLSAKDNVNVGLRFLFGDKSLLRDYLVRYASGSKLKRYGDADHWVLQLKPRKRSPHFKGLVLVVDKASSRVDRFVVYNHDGASNYFELNALKTNTGIPDTVFQKKIPKGYVETKE